MPPAAYTILRRIDPPERCYLSELLLWRAFGRFPEIEFASSGKDWRFDSDVRDEYRAPIPNGFELTEEECQYAGLPDDPRSTALLNEKVYLDLEDYDRILAAVDDVDSVDRGKVNELREERVGAERFHAELDEWLVEFQEFVDQFQAELCLKLRRGELIASGTQLPHPDLETSRTILETSGKWFDDLDVIEIEQKHWVTQSIHWEDSAIFGHSDSFIWIHVSISDLLRASPPQALVRAHDILPVGISFALTSSAIRDQPFARSRRGRPSLPWHEFHIEVARMFRDREMPLKKEAAIAHIQKWFVERLGKAVSRAAIGERLKPYYDQLIRG